MEHKKTQICNTTVIKTGIPNLIRVQVEKTRRAYEIGIKSNFFKVPKVLDYDEKKGIAIFERLDVYPISKCVPWGEQRIKLAECLGTSLAIIHRDLILPDDMRVPLPTEFAFPYDEVYLHADLSVDNVCVGDSWPPIVILDWQMTPLYGGRSTYGTRYFDIFWFIANLIYRPYTRFLFSNPVMPVARMFIESYFREAQILFDSQKVVTYAKKFFEIEMPRVKQEIKKDSKGRARLLFPFCMIILRKLVESLKVMNLSKKIPL